MRSRDGRRALCSLQRSDQQLTQVVRLQGMHPCSFAKYLPFQALKLLHAVARVFLYLLTHCFGSLAIRLRGYSFQIPD